MTRVTSHQTTVTRYVWVIPCDGTYDSVGAYAFAGEVRDAVAMATSQAKELGLDTSFDDWYKISPRDHEIWIYFDADFDTKNRPEPGGSEGETCIVVPEIGFKGGHEKDSERYRAASLRITEGSSLGGSNTTRAVSVLLARVAEALEVQGR